MAFTFFFRDMTVLEQIVRYVVPSVSGVSKVRFWDAGCAMGPEPYSLAIILAESMGRFAFRNIRIDATDIDETDTFGKTIACGVYPADQLKRLPPEIFEKYFRPEGTDGLFLIDEEVRQRLHFAKHDLLTLVPPGSGYHLIMCKNVLLHFTGAERIEVIKMFHRALAPGGYFATEHTQKMPDEIAGLFDQVTADAQLFVKRGLAA